MRLDVSEASFADATAREGWEKVYSQLVRGEMPPPEMPRLNPDDLEVVTSWIRRESERSLITERGGAGRTVMRRLTRVEYARLLEDVLGLHFKSGRLNLHERLPIDPLGFVWAEFDHLGQKAARKAGKPDTPAPVVAAQGNCRMGGPSPTWPNLPSC